MYNTEGPGNENNLVVLPGAISINPLNWKRDETYASAEENLGGYIVNEQLAKMEYVPHAADAQINLKRGVIVTTTKALEPMPGPKPFGNASYHNGDYALYYYNIKANVAARIAAYKKASQKADLVVYGKIFTAEGNQRVEAFAVKDGKFIYVGDKAGAEAYVEAGKTEVLDYSGKGLVMPGCGNGHAHYSMGYAIKSVGTTFGMDVTVDQFFQEIVPAAVKKARDTGATSVFGQGWNAQTFSRDIDYRRQMDAICSDLPIFLGDEEGHKALVNTNLLVKSGIMKADGTVLKSEVRGGEIVMGADGTPTGYLSEQACKYVRSFMDNESLYTIDIAKANLASCQEQLLAEGYTMYLDGYSSYFFNDHFYKAAQQMDQAGELHLLLGAAWEMESWMDVDDNLAKAKDTQKYASKHIFPRWLKMFMDGTVESGTGYIEPLYLDGHQGIPNWTEEELTDISRKANFNLFSKSAKTILNYGAFG